VLEEPAQLAGMEGYLSAGAGPELAEVAQEGDAIGAGLAEPQLPADVYLQVAPCPSNQPIGAW
jgi:hypothetical protein